MHLCISSSYVILSVRFSTRLCGEEVFSEFMNIVVIPILLQISLNFFIPALRFAFPGTTNKLFVESHLVDIHVFFLHELGQPLLATSVEPLFLYGFFPYLTC